MFPQNGTLSELVLIAVSFFDRGKPVFQRKVVYTMRQPLASCHHVKRASVQFVLTLACTLSLMGTFGFGFLNASSVHAVASQEELWINVPPGTTYVEAQNTVQHCQKVTTSSSWTWIDEGIHVTPGEFLDVYAVNNQNNSDCLGWVFNGVSNMLVDAKVTTPNPFHPASNGACGVDLSTRKMSTC